MALQQAERIVDDDADDAEHDVQETKTAWRVRALVLACDGVWDVLEPRLVAQHLLAACSSFGAAEQTNAAAVFAPPPSGPLAALDGLRLWWLRRALGCPLYTLGDSEQWAVVSGQTGEELGIRNYELRMKRAE